MPFGLDEDTDTLDFFSEIISGFEGIVEVAGCVGLILLLLMLSVGFGQWHERKLKNDPAYAARYYDSEVRFE